VLALLPHPSRTEKPFYLRHCQDPSLGLHEFHSPDQRSGILLDESFGNGLREDRAHGLQDVVDGCWGKTSFATQVSDPCVDLAGRQISKKSVSPLGKDVLLGDAVGYIDGSRREGVAVREPALGVGTLAFPEALRVGSESNPGSVRVAVLEALFAPAHHVVTIDAAGRNGALVGAGLVSKPRVVEVGRLSSVVGRLWRLWGFC